MKKKILSLIAVTAALTTAGCALVACGGGDDNGKVTTEVTKEQWVAAFNVEQNFTSNFKADIKFDRERDDGTTRTENATFIVGPEKFGSYSVSFSEPDDKGKKKYEEEMIAIIGKETDIGYSRKSRNDENGKWVVGEWLVDEDKHRDVNLESWTRMLGNMDMNSCVFSFADEYDSFKYESNQYVLAGDGIVVEEYSEDGYSRKETATEATFI